MEATDTDQVRIGRNAAEVLGNEAYQMAMSSMREQIVQQWRECPIRDAEGQRLLLQLAKVAEKFESTLAGYVQAGRLAQHRIDLDEQRNESAAQRAARKITRTFRR